MKMRLSVSLLLAVLLMCLGGSSATLAADLPRVTNVTIPAYPATAVADKVGGAVLVDVEVNAEGAVTEARAISGPGVLREAAQKAASRWRFEPVGEGAMPRSVRLTFIFHEPSYVAPKKKPQFTSPYQVEVEWGATADCFNNC
jgi:TonB family protein